MDKTIQSLRGKRILSRVSDVRTYSDEEALMVEVLEADAKWKLLAETQKKAVIPKGWWVRSSWGGYRRENGDVFGYEQDPHLPAVDYSLPNPFEPLVTLRKLWFQFSYFLEEETSPVSDDLDCFATCLTVMPDREVEDVLAEVGLMKRR